MLYYPWRNECKDLLGSSLSYQERYKQVEYVVNRNKQNYEHHSNILDAAVDDIQHQNNEENSQPVAPNTQHINDQDLACKTKPSELLDCFDPGTSKEYSQCDIFNDTEILPRSNDEEGLQQNRISDSDYRKLVCSLNKKTKRIFYHELLSIKTKDEPLRLFLSGGAGVGKSTLTNAFY